MAGSKTPIYAHIVELHAGLDRVREGVQREVLWQEPVVLVKFQHLVDEEYQGKTPDFACVLVKNHHNLLELKHLQAQLQDYGLTLIEYNSFTQDELRTAKPFPDKTTPSK
jgi:hypothetical protein